MSRKNFKVATAQDGKTPTQDTKHTFVVKKTNVPTGTVKSLEDTNKRKEERKKQYENFRVNALKRRAKRMGLDEKEIEEKVKKLIEQINSPNQYNILIMFNPNDYQMIKEMLLNDSIQWKLLTTTYGFIDGDGELLDDLRKMLPAGCKIYPYVKKKTPLLPKPEPKKAKAKPKTKAEKKSLAAAAKLARKKKNMQMHANRGEHAKARKAEHCKRMRAIAKAKKLFEKRVQKAIEKQAGTVVQMKSKKASNTSKKVSTSIKKAA
jgi:hypothetical protein